ncbi:hypothetical protein BC332_05722 [Capsicum chinense]|nr:hypothetical protein BC332_05722 [Capsicum chinense]
MANEQSRLCGLIDHYLRPYTETESASLTKAMEKKLLIALSQVYTEIKGWMKEEESDDSFDMAGNSVEHRIIPGSHADHHHFSTKFIEVLMIVVATENPYIHHLVGNILVAVSEFLVESESCWGEYINLLYLCVKVSIFNGLSSMGHMMEVKDSSRDPSPSPLSKRSLKSASWPTAAVIMRVLHNVLKQLNRDLSDEFFNIYLEDTTSFISNMPWNLLSEVYHVHRDSNSDHLLQMQEAKPKSILVFQGYLLRLLCSSVKGGWTDAAVIASAEHPFIFEIKNLLPRLLSSCLSNGQHSDNVAICQYLKHKMLDDILFEMLLQMLCLPFYSEKFTNEVALSDAEVREFSLISHLFHPIHFFHLFLSGIHYDHQVLLDYLISKDTGSNSAEYLLRCLRKVCDSWNIFVTFSWSGKCQSRKKKKFSTDDYNSEGEISIAPSCVSGDFLSRDSKRKKAYGCRHEDYVTQMSPFKCARNCLFQLKASIESLHQKNLFPYNPQVLLRRLTRFQELCGDEGS